MSREAEGQGHMPGTWAEMVEGFSTVGTSSVWIIHQTDDGLDPKLLPHSQQVLQLLGGKGSLPFAPHLLDAPTRFAFRSWWWLRC